MKLTELQEKWLTELESDSHKQGKHLLFDGEAYCCLGVACRFVLNIEPIKVGEDYLFEECGGALPSKVSTALKMRCQSGSIGGEYHTRFYEAIKKTGYNGSARPALTGYNDGVSGNGATFKQIAEAIRAVPEAVFTNDDKELIKDEI